MHMAYVWQYKMYTKNPIDSATTYDDGNNLSDSDTSDEDCLSVEMIIGKDPMFLISITKN